MKRNVYREWSKFSNILEKNKSNKASNYIQKINSKNKKNKMEIQTIIKAKIYNKIKSKKQLWYKNKLMR